MPKIKTSRTKKPPSGYSEIEPTIEKLLDKKKEITTKKSSTVSKNEYLWETIQIHHQLSKYIYEMFYIKNAISKELYSWLLKQKYADGNLIAKWRKQGYEKLCCLSCIQTNEKNHGSTCICRVPRSNLKEDGDSGATGLRCVTCGCRGCASSD